MKKQTIFSSILVIAAALLLIPSSLVVAANPPEPTYIDEANGIYPPTLNDDSYADWDLNNDFFADMLWAWGLGGHDEVLAELYLRYDCGSGYLYALVRPVEIDGTTPTIRSEDTDEHWITIDGTTMVIDTDGYDGSPPDLAFINDNGTTAEGWEAVFFLAQGSYSLNAHTNVNYDGESQTAGIEDQSTALLLDCGDPTAVDLVSFTGKVNRRGVAVLNWETASEIDNLGFNVYRATSPNGRQVRLNRSLLPSQVPPGSPTGAVYTFRDARIRMNMTYYYWLESVDVRGQGELFGPVEVKVEPSRSLPLRQRSGR